MPPSTKQSAKPVFSTDWLQHNLNNWQQWLAEFKGQPNLHFLEIGCFEGRATRWLLENILTDASSKIDCVDLFAEREMTADYPFGSYHATFRHNTAPWQEKITEYKGSSHLQLRKTQGPYDLVYVDGLHTALGALSDAILSWPLLKVGGIMIFDDYRWMPPGHEPDLGKPGWFTRQYYRRIQGKHWRNAVLERALQGIEKETPKLGIDSFMAVIEGQYSLINRGYQVAIKKTAEVWPSQ